MKTRFSQIILVAFVAASLIFTMFGPAVGAQTPTQATNVAVTMLAGDTAKNGKPATKTAKPTDIPTGSCDGNGPKTNCVHKCKVVGNGEVKWKWFPIGAESNGWKLPPCVAPTVTYNPPTNTPKPLTPTTVPPTSTQKPPTATFIPPTNTPKPLTPTIIPPSKTPKPTETDTVTPPVTATKTATPSPTPTAITPICETVPCCITCSEWIGLVNNALNQGALTEAYRIQLNKDKPGDCDFTIAGLEKEFKTRPTSPQQTIQYQEPWWFTWAPWFGLAVLMLLGIIIFTKR